MSRGPCWKGYERVPGTKAYTKGSCRKKSSRRSPRRSRRVKRRSRSKSRRYRYKYRSKRRSRSKSRRRSKRRSKRRSRRRSTSNRKCSPGRNKKFAKMVNGKCIRFGDPNMTIKKHMPGRKKSFCARHRCSKKRNRATPGYQSCKKWGCRTG